MKFAEDLRVQACTELMTGDEIEAWYQGLPSHRGPVTELAPDAGVFWIMDHRGGGRKLLDLEDFVVIRVPTQPASPRALNRSPRQPDPQTTTARLDVPARRERSAGVPPALSAHCCSVP